ncbi:MAG: hypothetical protein WCG04_01880 [Alphaproteobacteria bacterium]
MRRFLVRSTLILGLCALALYGRGCFLSRQFHNLLDENVDVSKESLRITPTGGITLRFKEIKINSMNLQGVVVTQPLWSWNAAKIVIKKLDSVTQDATITAQDIQGEGHWQSKQLILHYHFQEGSVTTPKGVVPLSSDGVLHLLPHSTVVFETVKLASDDTSLGAEGQIDWRTKDGLLTLTTNDYKRVLALLVTINLITENQAKLGRLGNSFANFFSKPSSEPQSITITFSQGVVRWGPVTLGNI